MFRVGCALRRVSAGSVCLCRSPGASELALRSDPTRSRREGKPSFGDGGHALSARFDSFVQTIGRPDACEAAFFMRRAASRFRPALLCPGTAVGISGGAPNGSDHKRQAAADRDRAGDRPPTGTLR